VAQVSAETGIDPNGLLDCPPEVFEAIVDYLRDKAVEYNKAVKGKR
jgi:hypothetical protein